ELAVVAEIHGAEAARPQSAPHLVTAKKRWGCRGGRRPGQGGRRVARWLRPPLFFPRGTDGGSLAGCGMVHWGAVAGFSRCGCWLAGRLAFTFQEWNPRPVEFPQPLLTRGATGHVRFQGLLLRGACPVGQEPLQFFVGRACGGHRSPPSR